MARKVPSWNDIPFDKNASPEVKADEFDKQFAENKANAPEDKSNPYAKGSKPERRKKK